MKHRVSGFAVLVLAFMTAATFALPDRSFAAGTQASPTAENVQYYTVNKDGKDVRTGIKSIVIDQNTYTNISRDADLNPPVDGSVAPTINLNDAMMKKIAEKYVFPKWSVVAEGIFRDQANQLVTIEGSGMMTSAIDEKESFDRHFSYGRSGVNEQYGKYKWALKDLASTLGAPPSTSGKPSTEMSEVKVLQGNVCDDEVVYTGIYPINNLNDARTLMGKSLRACSDDNDLTIDDFLGNKKDKSKSEYRLPALADDKTGKGYCSIVTCVNRAGVSWDYDYNTFGIAVYDFDVTPIAAKNLDYITAAQEYVDQENPLKAAQKAGVKGVYYDSSASTARSSYITNKSPQASSNTVALAQNVSETFTSTTQHSFSWGMDQSIGAEYRWGAPSSKWSISAKFSKTFKETWATMKANAQANAKQENRTITTQVTLPGHTAAAINQNIEEITQEEDYQQPVVINYKVAVFAMSGDYYNGSGALGLISSNRYDKQWMSIIFDGSDSLDQNGCRALSSLYNRAVTNYSVPGYDGVRGKYRTWCDKGAWTESNKINWSKVASDIKNDKRNSHNVLDNGTTLGSGDNAVAKMASNLQFAEAATTNHADSNAMTTSVGEVVPLYDLKSVVISKGSRSYDIKTTQAFIDKQEANGGGDYEEAVPEALMAAMNSAGWNEFARARIAFLILDAPCHTDSASLSLLHEQVLNAAALGVRIVPVVCSGLGESGEYLLRSIALATNGTSFFLTDDSGIGHTHLKPTTDSLKVEHLNDMLVRTIVEFSAMVACTPSSGIHADRVDEQFIPNPFSQSDLEADPTIPHGEGIHYLVDVSGKLISIYEGDIDGYLRYTLPHGVYFVKTYIQGKWYTKKILL